MAERDAMKLFNRMANKGSKRTRNWEES